MSTKNIEKFGNAKVKNEKRSQKSGFSSQNVKSGDWKIGRLEDWKMEGLKNLQISKS